MKDQLLDIEPIKDEEEKEAGDDVINLFKKVDAPLEPEPEEGAWQKHAEEQNLMKEQKQVIKGETL